MNGQVAKRLFTRAEYHRMGDTGILSDSRRGQRLGVANKRFCVNEILG